MYGFAQPWRKQQARTCFLCGEWDEEDMGCHKYGGQGDSVLHRQIQRRVLGGHEDLGGALGGGSNRNNTLITRSCLYTYKLEGNEGEPTGGHWLMWAGMAAAVQGGVWIDTCGFLTTRLGRNHFLGGGRQEGTLSVKVGGKGG